MNNSIFVVLLCTLLLTACEPSASRPGLWLSGEVEAFPSDWSFSDDAKLIAVEVETPYGLPHSVIIWCVQVEGTLYIAASRPESKRWPGWVEDEPDVKLKLGDRLFEGRLQRLSSADEISPVSEAYDIKYQLTQSLTSSEEGPSSWIWRVVAR